MSRWYGSLDNRLAECVKQPEPEIGMLATEMCYSDRHPYEIVGIKDNRHISARRLGHKRVAGSCQDGSAEYEYFQQPDEAVIQLFKKKNGKWVQKINGHECCNTFCLGFAEEYYDPSF